MERAEPKVIPDCVLNPPNVIGAKMLKWYYTTGQYKLNNVQNQP